MNTLIQAICDADKRTTDAQVQHYSEIICIQELDNWYKREYESK